MTETLYRVPVDVPPAKPRPKKLTLLRRFWRRSRRYLLLGVMAFTLSFGLVAVPVVKAEADLLSAATIAEINGAMKMPLTQVVVNAIRLHPVGFALTAVAGLGVLAYATKDQWMPFVAGAWGDPTPLPPSTLSPEGVPVHAPLTMSSHGSLDMQVVLLSGIWNAQISTNRNVSWAASLNCKNTVTNVVTVRQWLSSNPVSGTNYPTSPAGVSVYCRALPASGNTITNEVVTGGVLGAPGSDPLVPAYSTSGIASYGGPSNIYRFGTGLDGGDNGFDPNGATTTYVTSAECIDSAGNISVVEYTAHSTDGMLRMPPCGVLAPGTHGTGKLWIDGYAPGSTVPQRLYDVDPMTDPDHPLCSPTRPGSGCTLSVSIDGKPCVIGDVQCENWTEIRRDDQTGARVSCNYGPYSVGVEQCNILERAYQIGGAPATEENIDGNPDTANWNQPNGDPWKPKPQPEPGTGNQTSTLPTTGTNPGSNPGEDGQNCLSQGWSWNPVSWVMVPTQCALQWAFVPPKLKVETALQTMQPRLEARGITPFVTPFMDSFGNLGGSGCSGPPIDLSVVHLPTFYPFSACADPMDKIASGVSSFFALSLVVQGGMSCIRGVAAAFGFNWGLGSSKTEDGS